eukprot:CAMPEP_0181204014 /NCGR_PEP_ID=MMETSP1096-20121128/19703_1 /TAXON_ID=156174 ORGANISM="Chrysochromulina ericina, Strain CCMP281" /NCGR_SAMPLE_ID=MMETSP1096 /ASSEMBLY_ACC=CAM_ASM_000453 /LENGTH=57 /DNA_ID=CAMNT_0023294673 /DNA_START=285 /DNA_END=458 /DNA_ORIENTATION=-
MRTSAGPYDRRGVARALSGAGVGMTQCSGEVKAARAAGWSADERGTRRILERRHRLL